MPKKVVCVHLLNDYSGSPLILSTVIKGFKEKGYDIDLLTCRGREGFLSNLGINYRYFTYRFFENKYVRLAMFTLSQVFIFLKMLRYWRQDVTIYINTLLPFGAGLAGKLMGKKVVYHVHEVSINPPSLKQLLKNIANRTASEAIYVSNTLKELEALPNVPATVIYNGLSQKFIDASTPLPTNTEKENQPFTVLMLCSLKDYKGVKEFVEIANALPNLHFELVINSSQKDIDQYFQDLPTPENLTIYPTQSNVHPFYRRASLVLNLSHPNRWVETFGMTILEAMHYGLPTIVPPVGGPTELVNIGENGYQISHKELPKIIATIEQLANNKQRYAEMSLQAKKLAKNFSSQRMIDQAASLL